MSRKLLILFRLVLAVAALVASLNAGAKDFSAWRKYTQGELVSDTAAWVPGTLGMMGLHINLEDKWHTYWINPGDSGSPVRLSFRSSPEVKIKSVNFPLPERMQTGPLWWFGYEKEVLFPIEVQVASGARPGSKVWVEADAEWLVCAEVCIPAIETFKFEIPVAAVEDVKPSRSFELFQKARSQVPVPADLISFNEVDGKMRLALKEWKNGEEFVDFLPFRGSGVANSAPRLVDGPPPVLEFEKANVVPAGADRVGVLVTRNRDNGRIIARQFGTSGWTFEAQSEMDMPQVWWMLLSAFIGGLILNLMPCVFPVLSIKLLSLLKIAASDTAEVRRQNLSYSAGVIISFLAIALLLSILRTAGAWVGWGFQLQSPVFLALLVWLFFVLALNLLGLFEIDFFDAGFGHKLTRMGGVWGSFFTGILAVVVASPCTAPFMGVALGFGLAQPTFILLSVFAALGVGLAFPYLMFAVFPSWVRILPKPGMWMVRVKQVMAVPLFCTALWLLWILSQVRGPVSVGFVVAGCAALALVVLLSKWRVAVSGVTAAILAAAIFNVYSANPPPAAAAAGIWKPFSFALLRELQEDHNVLVDMTADWCLTCKVNERLVLDDAEVQGFLKEKKVELLRGDWTQRNEEITRFLNRYDRVGVPFYVLYSARHPNGLPLPEVLTKTTFKEIIMREFP